MYNKPTLKNTIPNFGKNKEIIWKCDENCLSHPNEKEVYSDNEVDMDDDFDGSNDEEEVDDSVVVVVVSGAPDVEYEMSSNLDKKLSYFF